jgi:hypothetical protein
MLKTISVFMKNIPVAVFTLVSFLSSNAQYYYKDIVGTQNINQMIKLYKDNKVVEAEATGFDGEGVKNTDFSETHTFLPSNGLLIISTRNKTSIDRQDYRFNERGLLSSILDTLTTDISSTTYTYDNNNNPVLIKNVVTDAEDSINENEVHVWFYNPDGKPVRMLRIINDRDTTEVRFTLDNKGNVVEELPFVKNKSGEKLYYYYDDKSRLTDIVRYNTKARRLLPDYMFEYSPTNQVIQKITTLSTIGLGYLIWRYAFDEKGLKTKEATFNRDKVMTGKIEYSYRFGH